MVNPSAAAVLLLTFTLAGPAKQSWEEVTTPDVRAEFLPRSALVEVDGQARGRGYALLKITDPQQVFRVKLSAEGFETEEAPVEAGRIVNRELLIALRPAGFDRRLVTNDAPAMALAAAALWRAGRVDDAADYADQSLRAGNTPLANRVLGDVWRSRGNRDQATKYYTMYLSLTDNPPDAAEIRAWLLQPRPGDITIPAK
jgi:hypothetical protein